MSILIAGREGLLKPSFDCGTNGIQMAGKEMVCTFDNYETLGLRDGSEKSLDIGTRAELVLATLDDQLGLDAGAQIADVDVINRQAQADQAGLHVRLHNPLAAPPMNRN